MKDEQSGHKGVTSSTSTEVGGVLGTMGPGQLPRNEMQISNIKRRVVIQEDELYIMMQQVIAISRPPLTQPLY